MVSVDDAGSGNISEYTVSELSFALKRTVEDAYGYVRVRGELGRISRPGSGHVYLDLKDDKAVLSGIIWKGVAGRLKIQPEQGLEVIATGKLTTYPGQSKYQIIIESLEPAGLGALMALLEERRKKLAAEGLFDDDRKQPLPYLPRTIGVVTSPTGAVIRDILHRLADRFPVHVLVWPVRVQGETSGNEVAAGIRGFNDMELEGPIPRPDLIIVARGGGSVEDLWGFNDEAVVRAAADSAIPLISAVGHETDWTLIDYAADFRAPTPTGAAEFAVPVRSELVAGLGDLATRQQRAILRLYEERANALRAAVRGLPRLDDLLSLPRQKLDDLTRRLPGGLSFNLQKQRTDYARVSGRLTKRGLERHIRDLTIRLEQLHSRLARQVRNVLSERQVKFEGLKKLLASVSYQNVLERGFVLVHAEGGGMISRSQGLQADQKVALEFYDGRVGAQIIEGEPPAKTSKKKPKSNKTVGKGQGDLF